MRFRKLEDLPLDLIGRTIARVPVAAYVERYESVLRGAKKGAPAKGSAAPAKRSPAKKAPSAARVKK